jgi:hypothetical protein
MTELKVLSDAEAVHRELDVLSKYAGKRAGQAPVVENLLPALPGDNVAKLQLSRQGQDCNVIVTDLQVPPGSPPGETFMALLKDGLVVSQWYEAPIPPPATLFMVLPGIETATPGGFRLSYVVDYGGNQVRSDVSTFYIDMVPPNHGQSGPAAVPPTEIVNGHVTREILDALVTINMTVSTPDDVKQGDIYQGYYGRGEPGIYVSRHIVGEDLSAPIQIKIPKATIEAGGNGSFIFYCKYEDRVGNVGPSSAPFFFDIQLTPSSND